MRVGQLRGDRHSSVGGGQRLAESAKVPQQAGAPGMVVGRVAAIGGLAADRLVQVAQRRLGRGRRGIAAVEADQRPGTIEGGQVGLEGDGPVERPDRRVAPALLAEGRGQRGEGMIAGRVERGGALEVGNGLVEPQPLEPQYAAVHVQGVSEVADQAAVERLAEVGLGGLEVGLRLGLQGVGPGRQPRCGVEFEPPHLAEGRAAQQVQPGEGRPLLQAGRQRRLGLARRDGEEFRKQMAERHWAQNRSDCSSIATSRWRRAAVQSRRW